MLKSQSEKVLRAATEWAQRPLDAKYPVVYFDAVPYTARIENSLITRFVFIAVGIGLNGKRDVIGLWVGKENTVLSWMSALSDLKKRGVDDFFIACAGEDGFPAFKDAVHLQYPRTDLEDTATYLLRNTCNFIPGKDIRELKADIKAVYTAAGKQSASAALDELAAKWSEKYPAVSRMWRERWEKLTVFFRYPTGIRSLISPSTSVSELVRRLKKVVALKPLGMSDDELLKKIFTQVLDVTKSWLGVRSDWNVIYLQMEAFFGQRMPKR